jgi:phosphatidylglycerophosphatase A
MTRPLTPLAHSLLTACGLGWLRPAPGTWGSLPPVVLAGVMLAAGVRAEGLAFGLVFAAIAGLFAGACVRFGDHASAEFGRDDASQIVADEVAGMSLILAFLPAGSTGSPLLSVFTLLFAFLSFRVLDILKPFPAAQLQDIPSGWGVLLDDLAAALYALIALHLAALVI